MNNIILEGFWGLGKSTFISDVKSQYRVFEEPHHQQEGSELSCDDINQWYIQKHVQRFEDFILETQESLLERSILSSLAYQYAKGKNIEELSGYIKPLQEYKQTQNLLIIVLYTDYSQLSPDIQSQYTQEFFDKYYEFYRVYLPIHFGLVANFIKVHDENGTHITSQYIQDQINAVIEHDRVCQANVVCYRIQNNEPEFLVLKRNPEKGSFWQSITGGVHIQGLLFGNALRELEEELFITGKENNLTGTDYVFWYIGKEGYELSEYVFGYKLEDTDEITLSDEHTEYAFLPLDEAIERVKYDGNKEGIRRVCKVIS
jgi:8-oxo-dGTP pyrophosphatase MutT (NUDIX family)